MQEMEWDFAAERECLKAEGEEEERTREAAEARQRAIPNENQE
jgi:hypothetical protein